MRVYEAARSLYQTFLLKLNAEPGTLVASRCFHVPCRRVASLLTSLPLSIVHRPSPSSLWHLSSLRRPLLLPHPALTHQPINTTSHRAHAFTLLYIASAVPHAAPLSLCSCSLVRFRVRSETLNTIHRDDIMALTPAHGLGTSEQSL